MNKNIKWIIGALLIIGICLLLPMCADDVVGAFIGNDGKCDHCGKAVQIVEGTHEYCASCFMEQDGYFWN